MINANAIDGKPIKDFINLPYGEFEKLARAKVDPLWGKHKCGENLKAFSIVVAYTPEPEVQLLEPFLIQAKDEKEARKIACDKAREEVSSCEDMWIHKIKEIENA